MPLLRLSTVREDQPFILKTEMPARQRELFFTNERKLFVMASLTTSGVRWLQVEGELLALLMKKDPEVLLLELPKNTDILFTFSTVSGPVDGLAIAAWLEAFVKE